MRTLEFKLLDYSYGLTFFLAKDMTINFKINLIINILFTLFLFYENKSTHKN
jgi:hypothetical protein